MDNTDDPTWRHPGRAPFDTAPTLTSSPPSPSPTRHSHFPARYHSPRMEQRVLSDHGGSSDPLTPHEDTVVPPSQPRNSLLDTGSLAARDNDDEAYYGSTSYARLYDENQPRVGSQPEYHESQNMNRRANTTPPWRPASNQAIHRPFGYEERTRADSWEGPSAFRHSSLRQDWASSDLSSHQYHGPTEIPTIPTIRLHRPSPTDGFSPDDPVTGGRPTRAVSPESGFRLTSPLPTRNTHGSLASYPSPRSLAPYTERIAGVQRTPPRTTRHYSAGPSNAHRPSNPSAPHPPPIYPYTLAWYDWQEETRASNSRLFQPQDIYDFPRKNTGHSSPERLQATSSRSPRRSYSRARSDSRDRLRSPFEAGRWNALF